MYAAMLVSEHPRKRVYNRDTLCVYLCVRGPVAAVPQLSQRCREEATRTTRRGGLSLSASLRVGGWVQCEWEIVGRKWVGAQVSHKATGGGGYPD